MYDDDHPKTADTSGNEEDVVDDGKCFSDGDSIHDYVQSPLSPAHGYEDCLSSEWSESGDESEMESPYTTTCLSRSVSGSSEEKTLPPTPTDDPTPRPRVMEKREIDEDDLQELEFGKVQLRPRNREMLTLVETLALEARVRKE